ATAEINRSEIRNNVASNGGGIYAQCVGYSRSLSIADCVIASNAAIGATGEGGGIDLVSATLNARGGSTTIQNTTIEGNTAVQGGGLYDIADTPTIDSCNFLGNTAMDEGGGIYGVEFRIQDTIARNNTAGTSGGGLYSVIPGLEVDRIIRCR